MDVSPSVDFYRELLEDSPQATLVYGPDRRCRYLSPGFARMVSRPPSDYQDQPVDAFCEDVHPEDKPHLQEAWGQLWAAPGGPSVPLLLRMRLRSKDFRLVEVTGVNRSGSPAVAGLVLHFQPVVDRKRAEALLFSERERLWVTLRSIGDGVIATDTDGLITLMNPITEALTGWTQADARGRPLLEVFRIINEETGEACENPVERVFATGRIVGLANHTALVGRDGRVHVIEDSAAPIRDGAGTVIGAVLVFRDVTAAKKTAAELLKMQKLESIGVLAGGLAHDFNNILSAILGNASLGVLLAEPQHPVKELLGGIQQAARRASDLTQQLLTFSKGGTPVLRSTEVGALVKESTQFLLRGSSTQVWFDLPEGLPRVLADPGQLSQVVQNLVLNAVQAMDHGGRLRVGAEEVVWEGEGGPPLPPGRYVRLEFADIGPGIDPAHLDKIFEPYFTTKPTGSGLGLSIVYSIVKNHRGWVQVESRLGEGTAFLVWLPVSLEPAAAPEPAVPVLRSPGRGPVLVMDDEAEPRKTLLVLLRHLGYSCVEACSGDEALDLVRTGGPVPLALVDLTVRGGRGGRDILEELKSLSPGVRVIVTSGYSIDPVMADHRGFGFDGVLRKPFTLADLTKAVALVGDLSGV